MNEVIQTKGFYGATIEDTEHKVNQFLLGIAANRVVDVKYTSFMGATNFQHFALVLYKIEVAT